MAPTTKLSSPVADEVDAIVAEAADLCALEQIATLNLVSADSSLPSHLESRFRTLKSLPPRLHPLDRNQILTSSSPRHQSNQSPSFPVNPLHLEPKLKSPASPRGSPAEPVDFEPKLRSPSSSGGSPAKPIDLEPKSRSPAAAAASRGSPSPPLRQTCCFVFSPRTKKTKKEKDDDANDDEVFGEFRASFREQQRKLKKALKEQEKMSREAEKMVRWVKQASARMNATAIDDILSDFDDDESKDFK